MPALHDIVTKGSTDRSVVVHIMDSTDGTPETGVVFNTAGIALWYRREGAALTAITEATLAALTTAHADGGFLHVSDGDYRLDLPDAAFATGANYVDFGGTVTGMIVVGGRVRLVDYSSEDAVRGTTGTALPNAVAGASGGVLISGSNSGTTTLGALTVTGATTLTGNVAAAAGITVTQSTSNGSGVSITGNGTGHGIIATGGATGQGMSLVGGATSGLGLGISYTAPIGPCAQLGILTSGTMQAGSTSTTAVLAASTSFGDDIPIGFTLAIVAGTGSGQARVVPDWVSATDTATVDPPWTVTPDNTSQYEAYRIAPSVAGAGLDAAGVRSAVGLASANLDTQLSTIDTVVDAILVDTGTTLDARIPAALVSGRMDSSVGAMAANVITATAIAADAITDAKVASDVTIASVTGAVGSVTGNVGGNVTGSVGSVATGGLTAASFAAGAINAAAIATDALTAAKFATDSISAAKVASDAVAKIQNGLATPTNITAGTITTVTNLTNAPTAGDFTATMKTSIGTAVAASAVASVTAGVTVTTNNDKTGYALSAAGVDAVWDEAQAGHVTAGTFGVYLDSAVSGVSTGGVSAADIADAVLDEAMAGHVTAGTLGKAVADILVDTAEIGVAGAGLTVLATQASVNTIDDLLDTEVAAIKIQTDKLTFGVTNVLNANVTHINEVEITGDGAGSPFDVA